MSQRLHHHPPTLLTPSGWFPGCWSRTPAHAIDNWRRHRRASWFHPSPKAAAVMLTRGPMQFTYYSQQHLILCFFPVSTASHFCIRLTLKFCKLQIYPKSTIAKREELIQIFVFNWTIALQCCVHFCYTSKGISCRYMYVSPSFQNSFPPPTVFHPF